MAFIRTHPRTFLRYCGIRFLDTWTGIYDSATDTYVPPLGLRTPYVWSVGILSVLALAGLLLALISKFREALPLAVCVILFPLPYYITHSSLRYRHPIDPMLSIFAMLAVVRLFSLLGRWRRSPVRVVSSPTKSDSAS